MTDENGQPLLFEIPEAPKRQKTKWEQVREMADVSRSEDGLLPPVVAATLLDVSRQRMHQLIQEGTFRTFTFFEKPYVSLKDVRSFVDLERAKGRPWEPSAKELWRRAHQNVKRK